MTERYVKESELEVLAREWEATVRYGKSQVGAELWYAEISLLPICIERLRSLIATAQPREVDEDAEAVVLHVKASFIDTDEGRRVWIADHPLVYADLELDDEPTFFIRLRTAKRHERGEKM